jgi:hypothetical protein
MQADEAQSGRVTSSGSDSFLALPVRTAAGARPAIGPAWQSEFFEKLHLLRYSQATLARSTMRTLRMTQEQEETL